MVNLFPCLISTNFALARTNFHCLILTSLLLLLLLLFYYYSLNQTSQHLSDGDLYISQTVGRNRFSQGKEIYPIP
jgi:hypothetical protein